MKKNGGCRVQLEPPSCRLDEQGRKLPAGNEDWIIDEVSPNGLRISNVGNGSTIKLGKDHIHHFTSNPDRSERLGVHCGFLTLNVQLFIKGQSLWLRPNARPGEAVPPTAELARERKQRAMVLAVLGLVMVSVFFLAPGSPLPSRFIYAGFGAIPLAWCWYGWFAPKRRKWKLLFVLLVAATAYSMFAYDVLVSTPKRAREKRAMEAAALVRRADGESKRGRVRVARTDALAAEEIFTGIGDRAGEASALTMLGEIDSSVGDNERARSEYLQAKEIGEKIAPHSTGQADVMFGLGRLEEFAGNIDLAQRYYAESLTLSENNGYTLGKGNALLGIGDLLCKTGKGQDGYESYLRAESAFKQSGAESQFGIPMAEMKIGNLLKGSDSKSAREHLFSALHGFQELNAPQDVANVQLALGKLEDQEDQFQTALDYYRQARGTYESTGDLLGQANVLEDLGDEEMKLKHLENAEQYYLQAHNLFIQQHELLGEATVDCRLARIYASRQERDLVIKAINRAIFLFTDLHMSSQTDHIRKEFAAYLH